MTVAEFRGPGVPDDDDATPPARPTPIAGSPLDALKEAFATPLPKQHLALSPLGRPDIEVRIRTNVSLDDVNEWRKGAKDPTFDGGYDLARLACIFLANSSVDVVVNGSSTGTTLADPKIKAMFPQAADEVEAVREFFGHEDLWLSSRVLPALTAAWSGGDQDGDLLRPTTVG